MGEDSFGLVIVLVTCKAFYIISDIYEVAVWLLLHGLVSIVSQWKQLFAVCKLVMKSREVSVRGGDTSSENRRVSWQL